MYFFFKGKQSIDIRFPFNTIFYITNYPIDDFNRPVSRSRNRWIMSNYNNSNARQAELF
ncbi:hypothetical protein GCM10022198_02000 [Klugiella xanthotipulae]